MKKTVKVLLTLVVLFIGFSFANTKGNTVLAAETEKEYKTVLMDVNKDEMPVCTDDGQEWLFAGWFEDAKCEVAYHSFPTGVTQAYAKFVPEKVLSVKLQLTEGTNGNSDKTNMRLVSSVDSLDYRKVGFKVYFNGAENPVDIYTSKVYERIVASAESGVDYNYSPKVVDTDSEYFVTATLLNIKDSNFNKSFYIRPYWITLDGTEVYGENRFVTVEDGYSASIINLPVKMDEASSQNLTVSGVTGATVSLANYDGTYAHVRINLSNVDKTTLKSVTTFTVGDSEVEYRNLETTHVVAGDATAINADTSWYADYDTEDTFVIATSADLYGLAKSSKDFTGKTIYVVADIEANIGRADVLGWLNTDEEENAIEGATAYPWTSIYFQGVFDAQMHTISGINMTASANDSGFFKCIYSATIIRNLKLTNSYFAGGSYQRIGGIAGDATGGTIENVYCDVVVVGNNNNFGGFIGRHRRSQNPMTIENCWFAGVVSNGSSYTGAFIGNALSQSTLTNCLNTGFVSGAKTYTGGFIGNVDDKTITISSCLNNGIVESNATSGVGAMVGTIVTTDASPGSVVCDNTYLVTIENNPAAGVDGTTAITVSDVAGVKALTASTKALFASEHCWAIVEGGTPVLATFAEYAEGMPVDTSWYDEAETEYVLKDAGDLYGLAFLSQENNFAGKEFTVSKDIKINDGTPDDWKETAPAFEWQGIGREAMPFAGKFDGNMKTISGMYANATSSYVGLFNCTDGAAVIKNLKLTDSYFYTTKGGIGSIVGYGDGTLDTIYSDAIVDGTTFWVGGLVGRSLSEVGITMNNCWFDGEVTQLGVGNSGQYACTGGLMGLAYNGSTITNCLNTGSVTAKYTANKTPCVAGLVGRVNSGTITVKNCFNTGVVNVDESATGNYGPIVGVGSATRTAASDTYAVTNQPGENNIWPAGVTKVASENINGTDAMKNMKNLFTAEVEGGLYNSCWAVVVGKAPVLESFAEVAGEDFLTVDTSWYNGSGNYTLKDVADLYGFSMLSARIDFAGETISLSKNIDSIVINEGTPNTNTWNPKYEWISISSTGKPFAGVFDGNMKSIEGAYWNCESFSGLFSSVKAGAVIRNLSLKNSYMNSTGVNNGSLVGRAYGGTFDTVYSDTIIIGSNTNIGGLVGQVSGSATETITMNNCWFAGSVTNNTSTEQNTGGLFGTILYDATITNCLNTGAISMPKFTKNSGSEETPVVNPHIGGFVGNMGEKTILFSYCFNAGAVTYNKAVTTGFGTFTGYTPSTTACFTNSYSTVENDLKAYARGSSDKVLLNCGRFYKSEASGTKALEKASALFEAQDNYKYYWAFVEEGTPVLASFADYAGNAYIDIDTSWYNANKNSYTLNDEGDLYGFAFLSNEEAVNGYEGKTITLGEDITINEGTAAEWKTAAPTYEWVSACVNSNYRFKGIFNGNGKTISGLYLDEKTTYRGFFGYTDNGSEVRNFRIVNSFFNNSAQAIGSVAGNGRGSFDSIYSDAIVIGANSNVGGLIGQISGTGVVITNCWFDGTVTNNSAEKQSTGGIVGAANVSLTLKNCLNTGTVSAPNYTKYDDGTTNIKPLIGGLIGYATPTGDITVLHCLNTGIVSFNSKATAGFGSVIGRIGNYAEDATLGQIVVSNTYATSQSCWQAVSTSNTWPDVAVSIVDDNVIGGEDAKTTMPGLFDDNLTTSWVVGAESPILKNFATYANTEKSISALHKWVTSSNTLTVTLVNPITLPNPDQANETFFRQGGYTDGRYFYQAYIVEKDTVNDEQGNKVKVLKYDLTNPDAPVVWSEEQALRHANDVTFNSKLGYLVVCHGDKNISYFNIADDSLDYVDTVEVPRSISRIDYNEERDVYVTGTSTTLYVLNSDLKVISDVFTLPSAPEGGARQSVSCDNDYIYYAVTDGHASGDKIELIEVYDWRGQLVTTVTVTIDSDSHVTEIENISVVGDKFYIMVAEYSEVAGIQYDKPANVYIIDKSITE